MHHEPFSNDHVLTPHFCPSVKGHRCPSWPCGRCSATVTINGDLKGPLPFGVFATCGNARKPYGPGACNLANLTALSVDLKNCSTTQPAIPPRLSPRTPRLDPPRPQRYLTYGCYSSEQPRRALRRELHAPSSPFFIFDLSLVPQYCHQKPRFGYVNSLMAPTSID